MQSFGFRGFEMSTVIQQADIQDVWNRIETWEGVNYELAPLVRMTVPANFPKVSDIPADGKIHFVSYILLFGFLPIDAHKFGLRAVEAPHFFDERSHNFMMKVWTHKRTVASAGKSVVVTDTCSLTPRLPLSGGLLTFVYRQVFRWRHRRLARYFASRQPATPSN